MSAHYAERQVTVALSHPSLAWIPKGINNSALPEFQKGGASDPASTDDRVYNAIIKSYCENFFVWPLPSLNLQFALKQQRTKQMKSRERENQQNNVLTCYIRDWLRIDLQSSKIAITDGIFEWLSDLVACHCAVCAIWDLIFCYYASMSKTDYFGIY